MSEAPQALTANGLASRREAALQEGLRRAVAVRSAGRDSGLAGRCCESWPVREPGLGQTCRYVAGPAAGAE